MHSMSGGPAVPSGQQGRGATRSSAIRFPIGESTPVARLLVNQNLELRIAPARCCFRSLRDQPVPAVLDRCFGGVGGGNRKSHRFDAEGDSSDTRQSRVLVFI